MARGSGNGRRRSVLHFPSSIFPLSSPISRWTPVLLWMAGIFYFSSRPNPLSFLPSAGQQEPIDKVAHFTEYAGLLLLLHRALSNNDNRQNTSASDGFDPPGPPDSSITSNPDTTTAGTQFSPVVGHSSPVLSYASPEPRRRVEGLVALGLALTYAISDELHQELTPGRSFELADIGYDLVGMIAALGLIWVWERRKTLAPPNPPNLGGTGHPPRLGGRGGLTADPMTATSHTAENRKRIYQTLCLTLAGQSDRMSWPAFSLSDWDLLIATARAEGVAPLLYHLDTSPFFLFYF